MKPSRVICNVSQHNGAVGPKEFIASMPVMTPLTLNPEIFFVGTVTCPVIVVIFRRVGLPSTFSCVEGRV
jgi:hypothetical protein